jgi:hypothetical protein
MRVRQVCPEGHVFYKTVMAVHGMGPNAMTKLRASLRKSGLSFSN